MTSPVRLATLNLAPAIRRPGQTAPQPQSLCPPWIFDHFEDRFPLFRAPEPQVNGMRCWPNGTGCDVDDDLDDVGRPPDVAYRPVSAPLGLRVQAYDKGNHGTVLAWGRAREDGWVTVFGSTVQVKAGETSLDVMRKVADVTSAEWKSWYNRLGNDGDGYGFTFWRAE